MSNPYADPSNKQPAPDSKHGRWDPKKPETENQKQGNPNSGKPQSQGRAENVEKPSPEDEDFNAQTTERSDIGPSAKDDRPGDQRPL